MSEIQIFSDKNINILIDNYVNEDIDLTLDEFFKEIHSKFYSDIEIPSSEYFNSFSDDKKFYIHSNELIKCGIVGGSISHIERCLLDRDLIENEDYIRLKIQTVGKNNQKYNKGYFLLTYDAFMDCLLGAKNTNKYRKYFILLGKVHVWFIKYDMRMRNKRRMEKENKKNKKVSYCDLITKFIKDIILYLMWLYNLIFFEEIIQ